MYKVDPLLVITPVTYVFSAIYSDCNSPFAKILGWLGAHFVWDGSTFDASEGTAQPAAGLEIREAKGMGVYVKAAAFKFRVRGRVSFKDFCWGWMVNLLGQWLNFKLFGITYLVGKIKFKLFFFQGPLAE